MAHLKVHVSFPPEKVTEAVIYQIGHEYKVVTNIRKADVTDKTGWIDLDLSGEAAEIERAVEGLKQKGVSVSPIERDVIE